MLDTYGDVGYVPISWYRAAAIISHPEDLDIVPMPSAATGLTVREYQTQLARALPPGARRVFAAPSTTAQSTTTIVELMHRTA
ncbi:MAG: hypothetical protein R2715_16730 [Ilumatobacteraceae bacterium]